MATAQTIFAKLRSYETEGKPLHALIAKSADVGDELVEALDPINIRKAAELLIGHGHGLHGGLLIVMADAQERVLARAYATNGDTPDNGVRAA